MTRLLILVLVVVLLATPAMAELTPDQFAYGLPLEVSGEQAVYELELPLTVYQESRRNDLGDLRVFNAAGQVVPYVLRRPVNRTHQEEVVTSTLPFFPLATGIAGRDDDFSIHVERSAEGTIINVRSADKPVPASGSPGSYLIDASPINQRIDALELLWPEATEPFLAEVTMETSADLARWQPMVTAAVARLSYGSYRLDQNRIPLPRENRTYLLLRWKTGAPPATLSGIRVLSRQNTQVLEPPRRILELGAVPVGEGRYRIELPGSLPVTAVTIELPERNSLAAVRLVSADSAKGPHHECWRGLAYNLSSNGSTLSNHEIELPVSRQRFWELSLEPNEANLGVPPRLRFGWQPDRLLFLAQGEGPFLLAYGSGAVAPASFSLDSLLNGTTQGVLKPQLVNPGDLVELGGKGAAYRPPRPWKKYSLWLALVLGVLFIGGMSLSLCRALRNSGEK